MYLPKKNCASFSQALIGQLNSIQKKQNGKIGFLSKDHNDQCDDKSKHNDQYDDKSKHNDQYDKSKQNDQYDDKSKHDDSLYQISNEGSSFSIIPPSNLIQ